MAANGAERDRGREKLAEERAARRRGRDRARGSVSMDEDERIWWEDPNAKRKK
jgi:hypothetical protein